LVAQAFVLGLIAAPQFTEAEFRFCAVDRNGREAVVPEKPVDVGCRGCENGLLG